MWKAFNFQTLACRSQLTFLSFKPDVAEAAGGSLDSVVKVNIFLTDLNDFPDVDKVMSSFFKKPYPARSTGTV